MPCAEETASLLVEPQPTGIVSVDAVLFVWVSSRSEGDPKGSRLAGKNINGEATVEQSLERVKGNF